MKLYLSGPMTGIAEYNYPAFTRGCEVLRGLGHEVLSPHEVEHPDNGVAGAIPWTDYVARDVAEFANGKCQGIVLMPGWAKSRGAKLELTIALALEFRVFFLDGDRLVEM